MDKETIKMPLYKRKWIGLFFVWIAALFFIAAFSPASLAVHNGDGITDDTCPGNDNGAQFGSGSGSSFTCGEGVVLNGSQIFSCTDVFGVQQRQVNCYPDDFYGGSSSWCTTNSSRRDTCNGAGNERFTCAADDDFSPTNFSPCQDTMDRNTGDCGPANNRETEFRRRSVICYPSDSAQEMWSVIPASSTGGCSGALIAGVDTICHNANDVGGIGDACYFNGTCDNLQNCAGGICIPSGGVGQPPLTDGTCYNNNSIANGLCVASGGVDEPVKADGSCTTPGLVAAAFSDGRNYCVYPVSASFTVNPQEEYAPFTVETNALASANASQYNWNWGDGALADNGGATPSHVYDHDLISTQEYTLALTVQHNLISVLTGAMTSLSAPPTASRIITAHPRLPYASFQVVTPQDMSGPGPLYVTVDASQSRSRITGSYIGNYRWDWGDGLPVDSASTSGAAHIYVPRGAYVITLTVTDALAQTTASVTQTITVTGPYVCEPVCAAAAPVCGPAQSGTGTQCYQCLSSSQCGAEYQCLGTDCAAGERCPDNSACPADGRCAQATACKAGSQCPDGAACPASGICPAVKNVCALSAGSVPVQCYIEARTPAVPAGNCLTNTDCAEGLNGGVCNTQSGRCEYARCLYQNGAVCATDNECAGGDGICSNGSCNYVYDCAYGPGLAGAGLAGLYVFAAPSPMPKMPLGVQPDGQACTQPTVNAPNNCEGINGCLYYNYNADGSAVAAGAHNPLGNSVANCVNEFEGGTGCVYYGNQAASASAAARKANCLPRAKPTKQKPAHAGIPEGCEVVNKGNNIKEYNCSAIDGCYYFADGKVDCTFVSVTAESCATPANCTSHPLAVATCNTSATPARCEYQGTGCVYEPNPEGAIVCPGAITPATAGKNFVQCLLNPDALLPGFALGAGGSGLSPCNTSSDCAPGDICLNGTCYPQCQNNQSCASGEQCTLTCATSCSGNLVCNAGVCVSPKLSCADTTAVHNVPYGTPSAPINIKTTQTAACRYELRPGAFNARLNLPFSAMPGTLTATADLLNHSAIAAGLFTGKNTLYVKCQNALTNPTESACAVPLTVGTPCTNNAQCDAGFSCINSFCEAPVCADALPQGALPYAALTTGTAMSMSTNIASTCVYVADYAAAQACNANIQSCAGVTAFTATGGIAHSSFLSGSSLVLGNDTRYARCQATAAPNIVAPVCQIPFSVSLCNSQFQCAAGSQCINGRCEPPECDGAIPSGVLPSDTTQANLSLTTATGAISCIPRCTGATPRTPPNLPAGTSSYAIGLTTTTSQLCNYDASSTASYANMTYKDASAALSHSVVVPTADGRNAYYAQCYDSALNRYSSLCSIPFDVGCSSSNIGATCTTAGGASGTCGTSATGAISCIPRCTGATPRTPPNLPAGTSSYAIGLTTTTSQLCNYDASSTASYANMTYKDASAALSHSVVVPTADGRNAYYAQCYDSALNRYSSLCSIPFDVERGCVPGTICPNGALCPANGQCPPCPLGTVWNQVTNQCDVPCSGTSCVNGGQCPATGICPCPFGTVYNATTNSCRRDPYCELYPADPLCGPDNFCDRFPLSPLCNIYGDPTISGGGGECNTLGYAFHGSAITPAGDCSLLAIILALLSWFAWLIGLLAVLSGLRAAFLYITSLGDEKRLNAAKSYLIYTTIGVGVAVLSFGIVGITRALLGI